MNKSKALIVLLALALVILTVRMAITASPSDGKASSSVEDAATSKNKAMKEETNGKGTWKKIDPMELDYNPFQLFKNWLALSVGDKDKMNAMTIEWGAMGLLWESKPAMTVYVRETHYTRELMDDNEYFTITGFGKGFRKELMYLGTVSGRNENKMKGSGLTTKLTELGNPYFEEGQIVIECKKQYSAPFDRKGLGELPTKDYSSRPIHVVYVGEIVNIWVKE